VTTVLSADWVLPISAPPIPEGAVAIEEGRIVAVGTRDELGAGIEYADSVILPGLVNGHSHLEYAVYAGFGDGLAFAPWIATHIKRKARIDVPEMEAIARLGAAECLASGITTVGDCSFSGATAPACADLGLRAIVYIEVFSPDGTTAHMQTRYEAHRARIEDALSDRVRIGISPHSLYTATLELWHEAAALELPMATHLEESEAEHEWLRFGTGPFAEHEPFARTRLTTLADEGFLTRRLTAAHCVWVDDEEIALLAEHGVAAIHCPRSNAVLGCGIAPLRRLLDAGVTVGLGTDSPASAPSFDMFEELRAAVFLARAREQRPDALGAGDALELATLGSARALGLEDEVGSLEPGKRADLVVVSLEGSPFLPWEDPAAAVVLGGSPERVTATLVDGEIRYERGAFDWHELRQNGVQARDRLLGLPLSRST
jgi:cytosine/adenosine deaminase-related metal-dependent hydrolase